MEGYDVNTLSIEQKAQICQIYKQVGVSGLQFEVEGADGEEDDDSQPIEVSQDQINVINDHFLKLYQEVPQIQEMIAAEEVQNLALDVKCQILEQYDRLPEFLT